MKTVLITGSAGFIGKNLIADLCLREDVRVESFDRSHTIKELTEKIERCDFIFHIAGVNRPVNQDDFKTGNIDLTQQILELINKTGKKIPVVLTSSIQATADNPYGKSKKSAEDALIGWSRDTKNPIYIYRLPNVFGKWSRPDYNSVVATFCHNIATGKTIEISDPQKEITFVYIDDVIKSLSALLDAPDSQETFKRIEQEFTISLGELAEKIKALKNIPNSLVVPDFKHSFDRYLYATFTSFLSDEKFSYELTTNRDQRGWLAEFIKSENFGQIFVSSTEPGFKRGNHWHHTKIEKFLVVAGVGEIKLRKHGSKKIVSYPVSSESPTVVDMPAGYVHSITNTGTIPMIAVFWSDEILDKNNPDTHFEEV